MKEEFARASRQTMRDLSIENGRDYKTYVLGNLDRDYYMKPVIDTPEFEPTAWLKEAAKITTGERRRDYGRPLINFLRIALRWSAYLGVVITPVDVAAMMIDTKLAREQNTPKDDNWIDIIGYAACVSDMHEEMQELGYEGGYHDLQVMDVKDMQKLYERLDNS